MAKRKKKQPTLREMLADALRRIEALEKVAHVQQTVTKDDLTALLAEAVKKTRAEQAARDFQRQPRRVPSACGGEPWYQRKIC
jgi:hypothetical protein